jgi:hypothetical protein
MSEHAKKLWEGLKDWHPLTELPEPTKADQSPGFDTNQVKLGDKPGLVRPVHNSLDGVSAALTKLLWDILVYLYSSISVRIKRLRISARAFENAKHEGCEKGFIIESDNGQTKYLIPTRKTFEALNMPCPYKRDVSIDHSFRVGLGCFLLEKDPRYKSVFSELKRGKEGRTSDIVTVAHNGTREAWEVTCSTSNILSNAAKYKGTDFVRVVFLCRDHKLREAVKACCREGGLDPDLLAKIDYMHFSQLLRRQRKLSLY